MWSIQCNFLNQHPQITPGTGLKQRYQGTPASRHHMEWFCSEGGWRRRSSSQEACCCDYKRVLQDQSLLLQWCGNHEAVDHILFFYSFRLVLPETVVEVLGAVRATTSALDPCPSWLIKSAREGLVDWFVLIINASLEQGGFPSYLKQAVVRPLLKKVSLDSTVLNNFRPISNLPFLGKVLERVVASQLQGFLDDINYLDQSQSGFRPGHGTETALVALVDDLRRELDGGSVTLLVLLDISAAFETIDHGLLLGRLSGMGLGGTVLSWLRSFLEGRSQMVKLGDACSDPWPLSCGVPQGSILSPMLFNIYMKPLGEVIRSFGVGCHLYADDAQLYYSFPPNSKEASRVLDECLAAESIWMRRNKLKINPDKTEVLLVDRKPE
uniref:Reverse transcriptase domain-containing protein n=1 Tax=Anolis carolinensis TaxID=28377 RepID=A0A803SNL8_ANOCA